MPVGRPPIPEDVVKEKQELYLLLVQEGKNERHIDSVQDMPSWPTRYEWQNDEQFSIRLKRARAAGTHKRLADLEIKIQETIERAEDGACPPALANVLGVYAKNVQWNAARLNREDYSETVKNESRFVDKQGNDLNVNVTIGDK